MDNEILTPEEVDRVLRYPRGRAARLARDGRLPAIVLPDGEIRFDRQDIAALLDHARRNATGEANK